MTCMLYKWGHRNSCKDRFYQEIGEGSHFYSPLYKQCCSQCITVNTMIYLDIMLKHIRTCTEICCADSRCHIVYCLSFLSSFTWKR